MTIMRSALRRVELALEIPSADPRDWPAWTDLERWTTVRPAGGMSDAKFRAFRLDEADRLLMDDAESVIDEYRPTLAPRHEPAAGDEAYWSGFTLGLQGEAAATAPCDWEVGLWLEFAKGQLDGCLARVARLEEGRQLDATLAYLEAMDRVAAVEGPRETDGYAPGFYS